MSKISNANRASRDSRTAPKFLLFLKTRIWNRSAEEPAKTSPVIEAIVLLFFCFVVIAILVITFQKVRNG